MKKNQLFFLTKTGAVFLFLLFSIGHAQNIKMHWPKFGGKTYDFILFQGDKQITAKDTIPKDGNFILSVPKEYAPYTGMCRWLITGTQEGGGLEISVPGKDFSVSCEKAIPTEQDVLYKGHDAADEINRLYREEQKIIEKHNAMLQALQFYDSKSPLYKTFEQERQKQAVLFDGFMKKLQANPHYAARYIPIVNMTKGIGPKLVKTPKENARNIARYFAEDVDFNAFYTSGHWSGIIAGWVQIHSNIIRDDKIFLAQFKTLTNRISSPKIYTDLTGKITYFLKQYGQDSKIDLIAPVVVNSGKITEYLGTMEVYKKAIVGMQAPDLIITQHIGNIEDHNHSSTVLKSNELAQGDYTNTLLIFYQSGCGPCQDLMQQLPGKYTTLEKKGIRIISISADSGEQVFKSSSSDYPWKDKYCDFAGLDGVNFKNYGVKGTPTLILLDKQGKIVKTMATLEELMNSLPQ